MSDMTGAPPRQHGPPPQRERASFFRRVWDAFGTRTGHAALGGLVGALLTALVFFAIPVLTDYGFVRKSGLGKEWVSIDTDAQYGIAIHEAGHVVVGEVVLEGEPWDELYVRTRREKDDKLLGAAVYAEGKSDDDRSLEELEAHVLVDFAGQVAEEIVVGKNVYAQYTDTDHATDRLYERIRRICREDREVCDTLLVDRETGRVRLMSEAVAEYRDAARAKAKLYVEANRDAIVAVANLLMLQPERDDRRTLASIELYLLLSEHALAAPEAEQKTPAVGP